MSLSKFSSVIVVFLIVFSAPSALGEEAPLHDAEIRKAIIKQSIRSYSGSCPCPYNYDKGGRRCGGRSAYSRPGGASPLCYDYDVTDQRVQRFREKLERQSQNN